MPTGVAARDNEIDGAPAFQQKHWQRVATFAILRVVPMTKRFKYIDAKYHVFVNRDKCDGLRESGMAMGEQTRPIDRTRIVKKIGAISDEALFDEIVRALEAIIIDYK